jgi:hypothetical protein
VRFIASMVKVNVGVTETSVVGDGEEAIVVGVGVAVPQAISRSMRVKSRIWEGFIKSLWYIFCKLPNGL